MLQKIISIAVLALLLIRTAPAHAEKTLRLPYQCSSVVKYLLRVSAVQVLLSGSNHNLQSRHAGRRGEK